MSQQKPQNSTTQADFSTIDMSMSRVRLRSDLVFVPQLHGGEIYCHIEVPAASQFYRVGYAEYVFLSLLDGETTFAEALTITAQQLGATALDQSQATEVLTWLLDNNLATLVSEQSTVAIRPKATQKRGMFQDWNPLGVRVRLCEPDRLLTHLIRSVGWFYSVPATVIAIVVMLTAVCMLVGHRDRFMASSTQIFSPINWAWMMGCWLALKVIHEFSHGLACKRYGGVVREMGVMFVLFAPLAYVDVTSSWRLSSKWQRIHVAVAGIYIELWVAAVAGIVWCYTDSELLSHLLYNLIISASLSTLLFNVNPLMRFDGYYILSDLLEIPNLYTEATRAVGDLVRYIFLGRRVVRPIRSGRVRLWILAYGVAASLWRISVSVSLLLVASVMFRGAGVVLAAASVLVWVVRRAPVIARELRQCFYVNRLAVGRAAVVATGLGATLVVVFFYVPNPAIGTAPGIVDYRDLAVIRSGVAGFVAKLHVEDGQLVQPGDVLLELRNDDVSNQYHELLHQMEQSRIRHQMAIERHEITEAQVELRDRQALQQKLTEKQREYDSLTVRAEVAGRVVAPRLATMQGAFVQQGVELVSIGNESEKELILSIGHNEVEQALAAIGSALDVRVGSRGKMTGSLKSVEPRASRSLTHPALSASAGGPLSVRQTEDHHDKVALELIEPRFRATLSLDSEVSQRLACGERGYVRFGWRSRSIAIDVIRWSQNWIRQRLSAARSSSTT